MRVNLIQTENLVDGDDLSPVFQVVKSRKGEYVLLTFEELENIRARLDKLEVDSDSSDDDEPDLYDSGTFL